MENVNERNEFAKNTHNPPKKTTKQTKILLLFNKKKTQQFHVRTITDSCNYSCHMAHVFLPKNCVAARLLCLWCVHSMNLMKFIFVCHATTNAKESVRVKTTERERERAHA